MTLSLRVLTALIVLCALVGAPCARADEEPPMPTTTGVVRVGDSAPPITLTALNGKPFTFGGHSPGKPTLLVFWSYFCFPCQTELPELEAFFEQYGPDKVSLLAVSLDGPQYNNYILPFLAENKITYPVAFDEETESFFKFAERYGVVGTPTFFVVDDHGLVRFIHLGRLDKDVLRAILDGVKSKSFCAEIIKPDGKKPSQ